MAARLYDEDFVARVKDLAVIGLWPVQIAERLGLQGIDRMNFLSDICSKKHPLHEEYLISRSHREDDLDAAINEAAMAGDVDALELQVHMERQKEIDNLKSELFGV
jgi:hypothetical protein